MSFHKATVKDINVRDKVVLVRAMLNVPIQDGQVTDTRRLEAAKPTLEYLINQNARVVLLSHHSTEGQSLEPVVPALSEILGREVKFTKDILADDAANTVGSLAAGDVLVFENLRFHPEEEADDNAFAQKMAELGEVFVEDDFTAVHREHASIVGIPRHLPAVAGLQVEKEVRTITEAMENPKRPLVAIVGGAKISTKIPIITALLKTVDSIFVGGAMANTFFLMQRKQVGKSLVEPDQVENAHHILADATKAHKKVLLPLDVVVTTDVKTAADVRTVSPNEVGENDIIADIGHDSVVGLQKILPTNGTVIWNGPVGVSEEPAFAEGTRGVAEAIIESGATSIVGGGDTADFTDKAGLSDKFSFVSTGGGASLELMSGNKLPGLEVLQDKQA